MREDLFIDARMSSGRHGVDMFRSSNFGEKRVGSTTLRVPESSLTSVLTKPVVA
jgi:hypothetical protein